MINKYYIAEHRLVPDFIIRMVIRRTLKTLLKELEVEKVSDSAHINNVSNDPIALSVSEANSQHYEVPTQYFDIVLGKYKKYSACKWQGVTTLEEAEEKTLSEYIELLDIKDGMKVLDLGCGWGSFTLFAAERHPNVSFVAFSNSTTQKAYIDQYASKKGLKNVTVITGDITNSPPEGIYDRIISIEMMEHVRNHKKLFELLSARLVEGGKIFVHIFTHKNSSYLYKTGPDNWMANNFFTGGTMPSVNLLPLASETYFNLIEKIQYSGQDYSKTLESWLVRQDKNESKIIELFTNLNIKEPKVAIQKWRMFYIACSELFNYKNGSEWGVTYYIFQKK